MNKSGFISSIDIGSDKIVALIAEIDEDILKIIGIGQHSSSGVNKGQIVNIDKTTNEIRESIKNATLMAGIKFPPVFVGIGGGHIETISSKGMVAVSRIGTQIGRDDVNRVIEQAKAIAIPSDREISHIIPQEFIVNSETKTNDPVGMTGIRLEAEIKIVTTSSYSVQNIERCLEKSHIKIADFVVNPIASIYAVVDEQEKDLGVIMLDIGAETTSISVYNEGNLRYVGVVEIGGEHITRDIAYGLSTTIVKASELKKSFGCAYVGMVDNNEIIEVPGVSGRSARKISKQEFVQIIQCRVEEIFDLAYEKIEKEGKDYLDKIGAGIIITGGSGNLPGICDIAEKVFNLRARIGNPRNIAGLSDNINDPSYATAVGLLYYGIINESTRKTDGRKIDIGNNVFKKFFEWLKDI